MTHRTFDEQIANFNRVVSSWDINQEYKVALLGMIASLGYEHEKSITPEPHWIPVTERLPIEYDNPIEFLCTLEDDDGNRYVDLILWTGCDWENNYTDDNEQNKYGIDKVVGWMLSPIPMRKGKVTE